MTINIKSIISKLSDIAVAKVKANIRDGVYGFGDEFGIPLKQSTIDRHATRTGRPGVGTDVALIDTGKFYRGIKWAWSGSKAVISSVSWPQRIQSYFLHVGGDLKKRNALHKGQPGLGKIRYKGKIVVTKGKDTLESSIIARGAAMIFKPVNAEIKRACARLK